MPEKRTLCPHLKLDGWFIGMKSCFRAPYVMLLGLWNKKVCLFLSMFVSVVYQSYCMAGRINDTIMSFDGMDKYDVENNDVAINSLLSVTFWE